MPTRLANKDIFIVFLDVLSFLFCFTSSYNNVFVSVLLTILLMGYILIGKYMIKLSGLDVLLFLLLVWEFLATVLIEKSSINYLISEYQVTILYFIIRLTLTNIRYLRQFLRSINLIGLIISAFCIVAFFLFKNKVLFAGFENIYDFKHLYRPFGNLNNVWGTIILSFAGVSILDIFFSGKKPNYFSLICFAVSVFCLLGFFSRGIYISLALVLLLSAAFLLLSKLKNSIKIIYSLVIIFTIILFSCSNLEATLRTVKLVETESQQRSIENRLDFTDYIVPVIKSSPLMGYGTGNYSLAVNQYLYEDDNHTFTNFSPNIIAQLFVEKGIVGGFLWLSVYCYLFIALCSAKKIFKNYRLAILLFAILLIGFVRELSFPAMLISNKILLLFTVFLALFQNDMKSGANLFIRSDMKIVSTIILCIFSLLLFFSLRNAITEKHYKKYIELMQSQDYFAAIAIIEKAPNTTLSCLYCSIAYWHIYIVYKDIEYLRKSLEKINEAIIKTPEDITLCGFKAIILYHLDKREQALQIIEDLTSKYPQNTNFHLIMADILYDSGCGDASVEHFVQAILLNPEILESSEWRNFVKQDKVITELIMQQTMGKIKNMPEDPILLSKYGKLHYLTGNMDSAKIYLEKATASLPNLETPWVYLTKIANCHEDPECRELFKKLSLWGYNKDRLTTYDNKYERDVWPIMPEYSKYKMKMMTWYKTIGSNDNLVKFTIRN